MQEDTTSEFNAGVAFSETLRFILNAADKAAMSNNSQGWYQCLSTFRREISDDMNEKEMQEANFRMADCSRAVNAHSAMQRNGLWLKSIPPDVYWKLDQFEIFLRKLQHKYGYKTKYRESPGLSLK